MGGKPGLTKVCTEQPRLREDQGTLCLENGWMRLVPQRWKRGDMEFAIRK